MPKAERKRPPRPGEGRPRLGANSRGWRIIVTAEQLARWQAAADDEGVSLSEWARDALDDAAQRGER